MYQPVKEHSPLARLMPALRSAAAIYIRKFFGSMAFRFTEATWMQNCHSVIDHLSM
jgi:hypothetical protein